MAGSKGFQGIASQVSDPLSRSVVEGMNLTSITTDALQAELARRLYQNWERATTHGTESTPSRWRVDIGDWVCRDEYGRIRRYCGATQPKEARHQVCCETYDAEGNTMRSVFPILSIEKNLDQARAITNMLPIERKP